MASTNHGRLSRVVNIEDLRRLAKGRLPRAVFDYLDGGAEDEITLAANCTAFRDLLFRPRNAVDIGSCQMGTEILGQKLSVPFLLAPVGYSRLMHPGGEIAAASVASKIGTAYILSTISGHKLERVKEASQGPVWYQLYLVGGRETAEGAIDRARRAGFSALVITVDTAVAGMRERDPRNGMKQLLGQSLIAKVPFVPNIVAHPRWLLGFLMDGGVPDLENIVVPGQGPMKLIDVGAALAKSTVTWEDMRWIRNIWHGPVVVKGILTGEDARRAVDVGADAVVVSNHGGRQLDCVSATLHVLPEVVSAVGDQVQVLMDGGIRRGGDVVKALCLGARAVLLGRAYAYGLAAAGEAGVTRALEIIRSDIERTLRLLGCASLSDLNCSYLETSGNARLPERLKDLPHVSPL